MNSAATVPSDTSTAPIPTATATATATADHSWSESAFEEMAKLWNLNHSERNDMLQLKVILQDIDHWKNDPFEVARYYKEYRTVKKTAYMFRRMVEWRRSNKVDTFMEQTLRRSTASVSILARIFM